MVPTLALRILVGSPAGCHVHARRGHAEWCPRSPYASLSDLPRGAMSTLAVDMLSGAHVRPTHPCRISRPVPCPKNQPRSGLTRIAGRWSAAQPPVAAPTQPKPRSGVTIRPPVDAHAGPLALPGSRRDRVARLNRNQGVPTAAFANASVRHTDAPFAEPIRRVSLGSFRFPGGYSLPPRSQTAARARIVLLSAPVPALRADRSRHKFTQSVDRPGLSVACAVPGFFGIRPLPGLSQTSRGRNTGRQRLGSRRARL